MNNEDKVKDNIKNLKFAKTVNVGDAEYTLQKLPVREAMKLREETSDNQTEFYERMLEHVVVHPKKKIEDFGYDMHLLDELMKKATEYQYQGK